MWAMGIFECKFYIKFDKKIISIALCLMSGLSCQIRLKLVTMRQLGIYPSKIGTIRKVAKAKWHKKESRKNKERRNAALIMFRICILMRLLLVLWRRLIMMCHLIVKADASTKNFTRTNRNKHVDYHSLGWTTPYD